MPVLDDLGVLLQTAGYGILGSDICLAFIPEDAPGGESPDAVIGLFEIPSLPPEMVHDIPGPAVDCAAVQVRVRGEPHGYAAAQLKASSAWRLLASLVNTTINGVLYRQILPLGRPHGMPPDEWHRPSVVCEYMCYRDGQAP
jgi:hypothetical protein